MRTKGCLGRGVGAGLEQAAALARLLPPEAADLGLEVGPLRTLFETRFSLFLEEHRDRLATYEARREQARADRKDELAARLGRRLRDYLDQHLVDLFVRGGLVPSYSFPVDVIRLEVVRAANTGGRRPEYAHTAAGEELDLQREAALAISEYAPANEIVAAGRVWTSAGIAAYSREYEPERFYRSCRTCNHVELHDFEDALPTSCPCCGGPLDRAVRRVLTPRGFLTSAARPEGEDPGARRLRAPAADEARLLSRAPESAFVASDVAGVKLAHLAARAGSGPRGELFVVNRGRRGFGFWRCPRCEYARPADTPAPLLAGRSAEHHDPRTGERCPAERLGRVVDLGHVTVTDVCQLRFEDPLPRPAPMWSDVADDGSAPAVTLVEALRLAAARCLEVDRRELRGTWKLYGSAPDIALYDSLAGGAGIVRRIGRELPVSRLLTVAREILDCPHCERGCRRCLHDYANQRHWDRFQPRLVRDWLDALTGRADRMDPLRIRGARIRPWAGLAELAARLGGTRLVRLVAQRLADGGAPPEPDRVRSMLAFLRTLAGGESRLAIGLVEPPPAFGAQDAVTASLLEAVASELRQGRLALFRVPGRLTLDERRSLRILAEGRASWFDDRPAPPLFGDWLAPTLAELPDGPGHRPAELDPWLEAWEAVLLESLLPEGEARITRFEPGPVRELEPLFASLPAQSARRWIVSDPELGRDPAECEAIATMLAAVARTTAWPACIELRYPDPEVARIGSASTRGSLAAAVRRAIEARGLPDGTRLVWHPADPRVFAGIGAAPVEAELRVDLSGPVPRTHRFSIEGGLATLVDPGRSATVRHTCGRGPEPAHEPAGTAPDDTNRVPRSSKGSLGVPRRGRGTRVRVRS